MAGFFQQFLKGAADGFLGSPYFKDYKHASKTFTTNAYANAPKFKWLFHVYFNINKQFITDSIKMFADGTNHGLLVKSIELPKYTIAVQEMNQYNRKRLIQTKINYDPIRITFHDDNNNQIRNLWYTYYTYYYSDPSQPISNSGPDAKTVPGEATSKLNERNIYDNIIENELNWGYQGEISNANLKLSAQKVPFFQSIKVYGFNQHSFALYELVNPIIENFTHDTYSYSETTGTMENTMSIKYESVKYYEGALNGQNPGAIVEQFADPGVYDTELSPIARPGNNKTILGQGGLVDAGLGVLNDLKNGNILGAIQTAGRASRTFKNSQEILQTAKTELVKGAISAVSNPQTVRSAFNFPAAGGTTGNGSQALNATNSKPTYAPPIQVPTNNQIPGGP